MVWAVLGEAVLFFGGYGALIAAVMSGDPDTSSTTTTRPAAKANGLWQEVRDGQVRVRRQPRQHHLEESRAVLALEGVVSVGDQFGFGVRMRKSYNVNRCSRARPETRMAGGDAAPSECKIDQPLEGPAQLVRVRLSQHPSTLGAFAEPQPDATTRLPNVYIIVKQSSGVSCKLRLAGRLVGLRYVGE